MKARERYEKISGLNKKKGRNGKWETEMGIKLFIGQRGTRNEGTRLFELTNHESPCVTHLLQKTFLPLRNNTNSKKG